MLYEVGRPKTWIQQILLGGDRLQPVDLMQQLFTRYEQPMYRIAYSILHHPQQAEDAVSETFLKVLEHLDQVQDVNSSKTKQFLVSITRNTAINLYRRNQREREQSMGMEDLPTELADPHMQVYDFEQRDAVAAMLRGLSPEQQEILQQAQRKSIRVTSRSKRRIGIAAIAVAVAAAIPTSVYAANLVRSTTRVERSGQYAADLVVQPQTEQSTTDSTQQLGAQPLEDMGPVKINLSYIPDSFVKGEQGKLTYFNPETPYQGGISVFLWKLEGDDSEFRMAMRSAVDSEELHFNDNVGLYMQRNTVAKNDSIQMDKDALLHIGNSQYVVEVFGGEDLSKEEMLKVVEGISLTPVADASQADPADVYQAPQEEVRADAGVAESEKLRFDKDDITGVYQIGDTHQEQVVQFESGGPDLPVDVTISNIRIQDNFDGLDSGEINGPSDYASYLDADGNLVPNVRTYYEPGDGVNTVDTAIGTKEFQQKIIVADITYTNHTDQVADSICVCPSLFFLQEDKDSYVEYDGLNETNTLYTDSCLYLQGDFFYYNMGSGNYTVEKNNINHLQPGESATVQLAFAVNADSLPYAMLYFYWDGGAGLVDISQQ